ncbi:MAG: DUF3899 domain-containing protein [Clostridia bacterium]|nr:DUF3899 domain-containing protein [Clostridia bacterium]
MKKHLKQYVTYFGIGLTAAVIMACIWNLFDQTELLPILKIVSDSFTVPGVALIGLCLLGWVGSKGGFDLFGYSFNTFLGYFKRETYYSKPESYYDYCEKKNKKRKPFDLPMLLTGAFFLFLAIVFMVVFLVLDK